jgi:hypothetical protein
MCDIDNILKTRGILAVAESAGWKQATLSREGETYTGWEFPVYNAVGTPHPKPRWKNSNGNGPKYFWPQGQPERSKYYFLPGIRTAIQENHGTLFLASGEPDVLAYHAAGQTSTLCWMAGETSIPATLVADLMYLGVNHVFYAPDRDATGMRAAAKLIEALADSEITYYIAQLPGDLDSKSDVNQAWIDSEFDSNTFWGMLWEHEIDPSELAMYSGMRGKSDADTRAKVEEEINDWRNQWVKLLMDSMGAPHALESGKGRWRCPLPSHEDKKPSFRWSDDKTPGFYWPMCSCGIQHAKDAPDQVAAALNAPSWAEFKAQKALDAGYAPRRNKAPLRDPMTGTVVKPAPSFRKNHEVYGNLIQVLGENSMPQGIPVEFPYQVLHQFGGFARWLWTGKAVAVGGISGGGKTLLMRVLASALTTAGYDVAWWGPEWSPEEYAIQDLQRAGGMSFDAINSLMVVNAVAKQDGITIQEAMTKTGLSYPTEAERQKSIKILESLMAKPGSMYIIPDTAIPVDAAMKQVKAWADARRADGGKPVALFWDYLQLSNYPGGQDWKWGNKVAGAIKAGCSPSEANLTAFISTQSRKGDSERVRESNERLKVGAFQGLDESIFNLALTITPIYGESGDKQPIAALSVEKNSMGETGMVAVDAIWNRLVILDKENSDINLRSYFSKQQQNEDE